jgi:serine/threonine protein kinase
LTVRVGRGLCPSCLLGLALLEPEESAAPPVDDDSLALASMLAVLDGGAGRTVYLAEREGTRQLLSVEVVQASALPPTTAATFAARLAELRRLSHPGIAAVLGGWSTADGEYCVASEYVPGAALERYCAARHAGVTERLEWFVAACRALQHAHEAGVVHGRLGPGSIVMTRKGSRMLPVAIGFGPFGAGSGDPAVDVTALGAVLDRLMADQDDPAAVAARRVARATQTGALTTVASLIASLQEADGH